jgi:hypothetical protein
LALSQTVSSSEPLGRYLTKSNQFSKQKNEANYRAFFPSKRLELSVQRIESLTEDEIWDLGRLVISQMTSPKPTLYGVAEIKANVIERVKLSIIPDTLPDRHANIVNWPDDRSLQLSIAQELAANSKPMFV